MFSVGLDVDNFVSTELHLGLQWQFYCCCESLGEREKILLYAGNSCISNPLAFIALGKIYLNTLPGQSAGNFSFSTKATAVTKNTYNSYLNLPLSNSSLLNPNFVTGFTDGEGRFILRVRKNSASKLGWYVEPIFAIGLHKKDIFVLEQIRNFFGLGNISNMSKDSVRYWVSSVEALTNVIIPHFEKYPLITQKKADFILFKNIIELMKCKEHLKLEGLQKIVSIKASLNLGLPEELQKAFPNLNAIQRPLVESQQITTPYWLAGFASGEACFQVNIFKSTTKLGKTARLFFTITQHSREEQLIRTLVDYLGCGSVYLTKNAVDFKVGKIDDLIDKVIPFFEEYNIIGVKSQDYLDFKLIAGFMKNGDHLTAEGLDKISQIKARMNTGREFKQSSDLANNNNLFQGCESKPASCSKAGAREYSTLRKISEHVPTPAKVANLTDNDFGYFLAGLIEGDGWFGKNELHIIFAENDISLAYLIKSRIGHGHVYKIKDKRAVRYICKNKKGLSIILSLINGKLVSKPKYDQLIKHNYSENFNFTINLPSNQITLDNYWLAGFTQADGCFYISVVQSKTHKTGFSVRLEFSIKQNDAVPIKLLYDIVKMGNISQYSSGIWCYKSSGFKTAALLISYFDKFNLFAGKYTNYLKFRKVYIMITQGKHLEDKGIIKIKSIATKGSSETSTQEA